MMDTILRTAKKFIEVQYFQATEAQLYNKLFNVADESTDAAFMLDKLVGSPFAMTYRAKDAQARTVQYAPGSGVLIEPPIGSIKTPITEDLLDKIAVGVETLGGFGVNEAQIINQIIRQHVAQVNMLKNKQALDVLADGKFYAFGPGGVTIGQDIDFSRNAALNQTYDFTGAGTLTGALAQVQTTMRGYGMPLAGMVAILGSSWQTEYTTDTTIQAYMANNQSNLLQVSNMTPPELLGAEGLVILGQYRGPGMIAPVWLTAYAPAISYVKDEGETAEDYVAATEAIFFSLSDVRYKVNRGVSVLDEFGNRTREAGDIIVDKFTDNDPVTEFIRTSSRHCFVPALVNHTGKCTGKFS
jgi:hypothetical protein